MTYEEILFRTAASFVALLVLTRLLGKKQWMSPLPGSTNN